MDFDSLFQRYVQAAGGYQYLTPRSLQISLDLFYECSEDELEPWLLNLYTDAEREFLENYLLDTIGNGDDPS